MINYLYINNINFIFNNNLKVMYIYIIIYMLNKNVRLYVF